MSETDPMKCPCLYWARTAETLHDSGHHPKCDGTGQWKSFTALPDYRDCDNFTRPDEPADKGEKLDEIDIAAMSAAGYEANCYGDRWQGFRLGWLAYKSRYESQLAAERTRRSLETELQRIYDLEQNVEISSFWDGGWTLKFGDSINGFTEAETGHSLESLTEALAKYSPVTQ